MRYIFNGQFEESMLFCRLLIYKVISEFFYQTKLSWQNCVGVCTDGAAVMTGRHTGVWAKIKGVAPNATFTHCVIHRENFAATKMPPELKQMLDTAVKIINFVKSRPLNVRLLATLCAEMGLIMNICSYTLRFVDFPAAGFYMKLYELHEEVLELLLEKKSQLAENLQDNNWLSKLAYLADMFDQLNTFNLSLQGLQTNAVTLNDKISAFISKLKLWQERILNSFGVFPQLSWLLVI